MAESKTRDAILDLAQTLAQTRGFGGFSFKNLAEGIGIRTASVHHHFPTKGDLGRELMSRYRSSFRAELDAIQSRGGTPRRKLEKFAAIFASTLRRGNRLCLCGMLATEYATLPAPVEQEVQ